MTRLGYITRAELVRLYQTVSAFVLISDYEAFGLPIAEALCCGTSVLLNEQTALRELFGGLPGVNWTRNVDVTATAAKMVALGGGDGNTETIAEAARAKFAFENTYSKKREIVLHLREQGSSGWLTMARSLLHVSPTYYSEASVIGGGEKYILYMSSAIRAAAALIGLQFHDSILAFGPQPGVYELTPGVRCDVMPGRPWDPLSVNLDDFKARIAGAEIIVIHQCLSAFGLFVASHSRLAGKVVIGVDEGGGEHAISASYA